VPNRSGRSAVSRRNRTEFTPRASVHNTAKNNAQALPQPKEHSIAWQGVCGQVMCLTVCNAPTRNCMLMYAMLCYVCETVLSAMLSSRKRRARRQNRAVPAPVSSSAHAVTRGHLGRVLGTCVRRVGPSRTKAASTPHTSSPHHVISTTRAQTSIDPTSRQYWTQDAPHPCFIVHIRILVQCARTRGPGVCRNPETSRK
jgi:hypothetical protein